VPGFVPSARHKALDIRSSNRQISLSQILPFMNAMNGDQANGINGADLSIGLSKGSKLLWKHASPKSTPMYQFMKSVNEEFGLQLSNYENLHRWSIDHIDAFWGHVWKFVGIRAARQSSRVSCMAFLL
jgi:acetoacetyl-CoA synthetase